MSAPTNVIHLPARRGGKTSQLERREHLDAVLLALVYQNGGEVAYDALSQTLPCTRRELINSIGRLQTIGNLRRSLPGEPVSLTASARIAIMAGAKFLGSQTAANAEMVEDKPW